MINDEEFKNKLNEVHPGTYDMTSPEMRAIYRISNEDYYKAICYASISDSLKDSEQQRQKKKREEPQERQ